MKVPADHQEVGEHTSVAEEVSRLRDRLAQSERECRRRGEHVTAILDAMSEGYLLTTGGTITVVNAALCRLTGFAAEELVGQTAPLSLVVPDGDASLMLNQEAQRAELVRRDGSRVPVEVISRMVSLDDGIAPSCVSVIRELTAELRHEAEFERLATHDVLTGLPNHRFFQERLHDEVARAERHCYPFSLVILDLDRFTQVNQRYGHPVGDEVLRETARRLRAVVREGELLARVGGQEFAWILPQASGMGGYAAAERGRRAVGSAPYEGVGTVTISAGVCELSEAGTAEALYADAGEALWAAKRLGRNRCSRYVPRLSPVPDPLLPDAA